MDSSKLANPEMSSGTSESLTYPHTEYVLPQKDDLNR